MGPTKLASFMAKTFHDVRADYVSTISKDASTAARQLAEKISEEYRTENDESTVVTVSELNEILDFLAAGPMDDGNSQLLAYTFSYSKKSFQNEIRCRNSLRDALKTSWNGFST